MIWSKLNFRIYSRYRLLGDIMTFAGSKIKSEGSSLPVTSVLAERISPQSTVAAKIQGLMKRRHLLNLELENSHPTSPVSIDVDLLSIPTSEQENKSRDELVKQEIASVDRELMKLQKDSSSRVTKKFHPKEKKFDSIASAQRKFWESEGVSPKPEVDSSHATELQLAHEAIDHPLSLRSAIGTVADSSGSGEITSSLEALETHQTVALGPSGVSEEIEAVVQEEASASSVLSRHEREKRISNAQMLGLKLPTPPDGVSQVDFMPADQEDFFTMVAYANSYATIPNSHPVFEKNLFLEPFVKMYNDKAMLLRTTWESSPAHASLIKCRKVSKRGFEKIFFIRTDRLLGQGSFKRAYRARVFKPVTDATSPFIAAVDREKVKVYAILHDSSKRAHEDFLKECTIAQRLEEVGAQHILHMRKIDVVGSGPNEPVIAVGAMSEYCDAGTLDGFLTNNPGLSLERRRNLALELCVALDDMHKKGNYVHGDLKVANVFVQRGSDGQPHIKLADFGASDSVGVEKWVAGTFLSPEQWQYAIQGKISRISPATDAYTLGEVLYKIILGRSAFWPRHGLDGISAVAVAPYLQPQLTFEQTQSYRNIVTQRFVRIYTAAEALSASQNPYAKLFMGLFCLDPARRWTVDDARHFLMQIPV